MTTQSRRFVGARDPRRTSGRRAGRRALIRGVTNPGYVPLTGAVGSYISTADKATLDIIGDLELIMRVGLTSWTPAAAGYLIHKGDTVNDKAYRLRVTTTGRLELRWSTDGSAEKIATSTASPGFSAGVVAWIKATLDVDNGSSGYTATIYTAADQSTEPASWTLLGSAITAAGVTSIHASAVQQSIGANYIGTEPVAGNFYRGIVRNGIAGTVVADFDASRLAGSTYSDAYGNTWTVH